AFSLTVAVLEADGESATGYTGTVHFTSSETQFGVVLPADYTFTAADAGVHTFSNGFTLDTAGDQTITATDIVTSSIQGTATVSVSPRAAATFVVASYPSPVTAGSAHSFAVTAKDPFGNTTPSFIDNVIFSSSDSPAVLSAGYTFTSLDAGVHTFSATLKTAGSQSITVQDASNPAVTSGTQAGIIANPAAATHLQFAGFPLSVLASSSHDFTIVALDAYGNIAVGYRGTVSFISSDSQSALPANYTFTTADAGVHS